MIDEIFDRTYREGRAQLNANLSEAVHSAFAATRNAFQVLNRIEYQAPWLKAPNNPMQRHRALGARVSCGQLANSGRAPGPA